MTLFWYSVSKICKLPSNATSLISVQTPTNALPLNSFTLPYNRTDMISQEFYSKKTATYSPTPLYTRLFTLSITILHRISISPPTGNQGCKLTAALQEQQNCVRWPAWRCFGKIDTKIVTLTDSLLTCTFNTVFVAFDKVVQSSSCNEMISKLIT